MKKRKAKKNAIKKKLKKINLQTLIVTIVIPIVSIVMTYHMDEKSYQYEKRISPPIFYLIEDSKNSNIVKIDNVGGFASYLKFSKMTALRFTFGDKIAYLSINYTDKDDLWNLVPNIEEKDTWYFHQTAEVASRDQIKKVFEYITKNSDGENDLELLNIEDFYTLTYYDYKNESNTLTYTINRNGLGVYDGTPNYENCFGVGGMIIYSDDVFYERLVGYLENEIDLYYQYLEWQKEYQI